VCHPLTTIQQTTKKMVSLTHRTIIISAPIAPRLSPIAQMADEMDDEMEMMDSDGGPQKRRRLTHLSPDERQMRRKLKNRVAAQDARDRKKARMDELEELIAQLENENQKLRSENLSLNSRQESLSSENDNLRTRLNLPTPVAPMKAPATPMKSPTAPINTASAPPLSSHIVAPGQSLLVKQEVRSNFESAALNFVSLQKEPACALQISTHCLAWMMTASLICCLASCDKSKTAVSQLRTSPQLTAFSALKPAQHSLPPSWWGPQQQSWNPSKN